MLAVYANILSVFGYIECCILQKLILYVSFAFLKRMDMDTCLADIFSNGTLSCQNFHYIYFQVKCLFHTNHHMELYLH